MQLEILKPRTMMQSEDSPMSEHLADGNVRVSIEYVSLCGSDRKLFEGTYQGPHRYPIKFGHEWSGRVTMTAPGSRLKEGDLVTGDCSRYCGRCRECSVDLNTCHRIEKFGITVDGFSQSVVDVEERYLYRVPRTLPSALAAIVEPTAVAFRAVAPYADLGTEHGTLIVGAGQIGLAAGLILQSLGVHDITVCDESPERLVLAEEILGSVKTETATQMYAGLTYEEQSRSARYGFVFDATGSSSGLAHGLVRADYHGTIVTVGMLREPQVPLNLVTTKALHLNGSIGGSGAFPEVMNLMSQRSTTFNGLIGRQVTAARWREVFEGLSARARDQINFGGNDD